MERVLHEPGGYYHAAPRRSGASGDFITSVDVGPLFGQTVAVQIDEMLRRVARSPDAPLDLVEAGAGDGRFSRDILDRLARTSPDIYRRLRVTLVERSPSARDAACRTLAAHAPRVAAIQDTLPSPVDGVIIANELLDALPVHVLVRTADGPRELYVVEREGRRVLVPGPVSDPRLQDETFGDEPLGARRERGLAAEDWMAGAARALQRGYLLLFDYVRGGSADTLAAYHRHRLVEDWLNAPGAHDITAHVDLERVRTAARAAGLTDAGVVDQTRFLLSLGILDELARDPSLDDTSALTRRLAAKTLILPGGLGSTIKVMAFARGVSGGLRGWT